MKKVIRLTESNLIRLVKKVIKESNLTDGPGTPGHIDYLRDEVKESQNRVRESSDADRDEDFDIDKYLRRGLRPLWLNVPSYNPKTGGGWKPNQIKEFVFDNFDIVLPDYVIEVDKNGFVSNYTEVRQWVTSDI